MSTQQQSRACSSRQGFLDTCAGVRPAEPFLWESGFWAGAVDRWRSEGMPADADPFEYLGLSRFAGASNDYSPIPPLATAKTLDEGDSTLIEDESGRVIRIFKDKFHPGNPGEHAEERLQWPVRDRPSWEFIRSRLDPHVPERLTWARAFVEGMPASGLARSGFTGSFVVTDGFPTTFYIMSPTYWLIRDLIGFESTAMMLCEAPKLAVEIYDYCTWFIEEQIGLVFKQRVPDAVFLNEEAASKAGPFMSPEMYKHFALPCLIRIVSRCHSAGVPYVFVHSSGNIWPLIHMWLDAGVDGLIPIDVGSGMNPLDIRREFGPDIILIGGIDRKVLEGKSEEIEKEVMGKAPSLFAGGRYIPSGDAHFPITDRVSLDNMRCYVDALRRAACS